jgi:hypothetical protein
MKTFEIGIHSDRDFLQRIILGYFYFPFLVTLLVGLYALTALFCAITHHLITSFFPAKSFTLGKEVQDQFCKKNSTIEWCRI